ncbi:Two component regulator three Y domain-containing protein [Mesobacillus maritimus]|uniref:Two component regulator three Y domain-containing protein n=1 Tax=Mesobacillus maritimus TaxID=1643336 RepID=UPI00384A5F59
MIINENIYRDKRNVKYLFYKSAKPNPNLAIVFSGMPPVGKKPAYNYIRTLNGYDINRLYILDDFGCRASYYLCENKDYSIEESVINLIDKIKEENNIKNIISCGSSKGGYAALYYGIKYGFNHVIAGSPQTLLGEYLLNRTNSENIATFISGGASNEHSNYLDRILFKIIDESQHKPNVFIHVGKEEYHYHVHVKPLIKLLNDKKINNTLDLGDYSEHNDVGKFFPNILKEEISKSSKTPFIKSFTKTEMNNESQISFAVETDSLENQLAWYVFRGKLKVATIPYSKMDKLTFEFKENGNYRVKAYVLNNYKNKVSEEIQFKISHPEFSVENGEELYFLEEFSN